MKADHYKQLERDIVELLDSCDSLSDTLRAEVLHFIEYGEYGLALKTLVAIVVDEASKIPDDFTPRVKKLVGLMKLESPSIAKLLR